MTTGTLDIERPGELAAYLRDTGRVGPGVRLNVRVLAGGVSNRAVLAEFPGGGGWVIKQALPKLRVEVDWFSDPERVHREALGIRWLERLLPEGTVPPFVFEDREHHLLAMGAVPEPHENWKTMLLEGRLEEDHVEQFARLLGTIHRSASERREELPEDFGDRSFFESLRLEPYYGYAAERIPEAAGFLRDLIGETRARHETLVHGDYSPKNVLVRDGRLVLLDHEVIHIGDPAFDLGFSLTHFLAKALHLPKMREAFAGAAESHWLTYRRTVGETGWAGDLEPRAARHTLGCLLARVAGRSQLEYLDAEERARQREAALALMADTPREVPRLVERFVGGL